MHLPRVAVQGGSVDLRLRSVKMCVGGRASRSGSRSREPLSPLSQQESVFCAAAAPALSDLSPIRLLFPLTTFLRSSFCTYIFCWAFELAFVCCVCVFEP